MAIKPKKSSRPKDVNDLKSEYYQGKKEKKGNRTSFINDGTGFLSTSYTRKGNKEIMTNYEKRDAKGDYMKFEVPRGSAKTAQAERGKTLGRAINIAKRAEVAAARKESTKKLAKNTAKAERGKTQSRKNTAKKPKKLY